MLNIKPNRYLNQPVSPAPTDYVVGLHNVFGGTMVFGSESNSHFVDVVSLGPIGGIQEVYLDETPLSSGEFPKSKIYAHDGDGSENPWNNSFPYVERTVSLGKNAEITEVGSGNYSSTIFQRKVSSVGVVGLRVNFTTAGFTHKDDKNRNKDASARFRVDILDTSGNVVSTETSQYNKFSAKNPTAIQLYISAPSGYQSSIWEYRVNMDVMGFNHSTSVSGNWAASTATEVYRDTQTYDKIAYASGTIVASDTSGKIPKRQYLTSGYKVLVPEYQDVGGTQVLTGTFTSEVSDSPAWNAMAVITDTLWGAGQPLDKVDIVSFDEFSKYCKQLVGGDQRYSFSQYLIKSDNYYKLASEMVGSADGRLYEDNSGRIGVLIDKQTSNRRVVTSYDIVDEMVKRTTVAEEKKINYVEAEFEDRDNQYKKTIIKIEDENAITKNGVISKNLKLDTCTKLSEAQRTIKKMLVTSQVATSSYVLKVGHTHEDVQIGEVLEVYDRKFANVNYCGKVAAGSTLNVIQIDARTPINLTGIKQPLFTIDNNRGVPTRIAINSWTSNSITLATNLPSIPAEFTSFGVDDADATGTKPTLIRVLGVDDSSGVLSLEGVEYNDSLYNHVENGTPLVVHKYKYIPAQTTVEVTGLQLVRTLTGITASWDPSGAGYGYGYNWKFTPVGGVTTYIGSGVTDNLQVSLLNPLGEGTYEIQVLATLNGESIGEYAIDTLYVGVDTGSTLPAPTGLASLLPDGTFSTDFVGRSFTIRWDQVEEVAGVTVSHFKLRAIQGATTYEVIVDKSSRQYRFSEEVLTAQFGSYTRNFTIQLVTVDSELKTAELRQISITNPVPPLPVVTVNNTGSLTLSYGATLPTDLTGTLLKIWRGTSQFEPIPVDAVSLLSSETLEISLPDDVVKQDGTSYVFDAVWVDSFGSDSTNHGRVVFAFDPDAQIPVSPELTVVVPIDSQTVMVKYTHSGLYLKRLQVSYRRYGTTTWTTLAEVFTVPPVDSDSGYDGITQGGYVRVSGLVRNIEYEFKLNVSNTSGFYSEDSNYIIGTPYLDVVTTEILPTIDGILGSIEGIDTSIAGIEVNFDEISGTISTEILPTIDDLKLRISNEVVHREDTDKAIFDTAASAVMLRRDLANGLSGLTDAVFEVDPTTGLIGLKAYSYTDNAFNQANILIDGVSAEVNLQAGRVTTTEQRISSAESELSVQAGKIDLKASYTEVNEMVAGAIDAILPVYSFGFFNSIEGWTAVNGTISPASNKVALTWGDIQNTSLSYNADENPFISISIERLSGTGWVGDLILTFDSAPSQTYSGVISEVDTGGIIVRNLNLSGEITYTGTVTGVRLVLGSSASDTFNLSSVTIGKPSAAQESLEGLTSQVSQLGIEIDAIEGSLTNYVTTEHYTANSVTFNNLDVTLNGADSIISLKATQQELDSNDVITKANNAAIWIDASESNITQVVQSYNAQTGGVDDQLEDISDTFTIVQSEIDATTGLIRDQSLSINRLGNKDKDIEKNAFYAAELLLKQKKGLLDAGESIAIADRKLQTITDDVGSLSQELLNLEASTGTEIGQLDAKILELSQVTTSKDVATALTLSSLTATVEENTAGITSTQQAIADEVSARTTAINSLTATVEENTAGITSTQQAIADEVSARTTAIDTLTSVVSDNTSEITTIKDVLSTETSSRVSDVSALNARVGNAESSITNTNQVIADEIGASLGLIRDQSVTIRRLGNKDQDIEKNAFYAAEIQLRQRNGLLDVGEKVAIADRRLQTITNDVSTISQELLNLEASTGSELGQLDSKILQLSQVTTTKDNATSLTINSLTATVEENTAGITSANQAIATETSSRITAITNLTSIVSDNTAEINNTQDALATETAAIISDVSNLSTRVGTTEAGLITTNQAISEEHDARVLAMSELSAEVGENTAEILRVDQAVSSEETARVTAIQQLTAQVGEDIALVDTTAKAAIGYCTIGGSFSSHETKAACQSAGGTWINSTLATATRTVQVSSGGQTATVGSFYSSYVNLAGEITGKAVMGVDVNGAFTGMEVVGGNNYSQLTFRGNTIKFQNTAGVDQLVYDNTTNTWKFFGTIYAEKITGDVVELYGLEVATVTFNNDNKRERIATFTIAAAPFARNLVINPLQFFLGGQSALRLEVYFGSSIGGEFFQGQLIKNNHNVSSLYQNEVYVSSKPFYVDVTAGVPLTLTLALTDIGNPSGYQAIGGTTSGKTSLTLARSGASFSRSFP